MDSWYVWSRTADRSGLGQLAGLAWDSWEWEVESRTVGRSGKGLLVGVV